MLLMDTKPNEILLIHSIRKVKEGDKMLEVPMIYNPFCSDLLSHHSAFFKTLSEHSLVESNTKGWPNRWVFPKIGVPQNGW